jgi:hypothetical protein
MQDFGAAVKISEIMSAVEHQQAFERPTWSKQFGNWFELIAEWLIGWWKSNSKLAEKQFAKSQWKIPEKGRSALRLFRIVSQMNRKLSDCKLFKSLFNL